MSRDEVNFNKFICFIRIGNFNNFVTSNKCNNVTI